MMQKREGAIKKGGRGCKGGGCKKRGGGSKRGGRGCKRGEGPPAEGGYVLG